MRIAAAYAGMNVAATFLSGTTTQDDVDRQVYLKINQLVGSLAPGQTSPQNPTRVLREWLTALHSYEPFKFDLPAQEAQELKAFLAGESPTLGMLGALLTPAKTKQMREMLPDARKAASPAEVSRTPTPEVVCSGSIIFTRFGTIADIVKGLSGFSARWSGGDGN